MLFLFTKNKYIVKTLVNRHLFSVAKEDIIYLISHKIGKLNRLIYFQTIEGALNFIILYANNKVKYNIIC
jgi:hypothetical protein